MVYHGFPSLFGKGEVKGGRGDGVMGWMGLLQGYGGGGNLIQYFATSYLMRLYSYLFFQFLSFRYRVIIDKIKNTTTYLSIKLFVYPLLPFYCILLIILI